MTAPAPIVTRRAGRAQHRSVEALAKSASAGAAVSRRIRRIGTSQKPLTAVNGFRFVPRTDDQAFDLRVGHLGTRGQNEVECLRVEVNIDGGNVVSLAERLVHRLCTEIANDTEDFDDNGLTACNECRFDLRCSRQSDLCHCRRAIFGLTVLVMVMIIV